MAPSTRTSSLRSVPTPAQPTSTSSLTTTSTTTTTAALKREQAQEKKALAVIKPRDDVTALIPASVRFPLLVVLSLIVSAMGYSGLSALGEYRKVGEGELAGVSRRLGEWWEVGALILWKG